MPYTDGQEKVFEKHLRALKKDEDKLRAEGHADQADVLKRAQREILLVTNPARGGTPE